MDTVPSYDALLQRIRTFEGGLVGIEGFRQSGKSTLADKLGEDVPAHVVHTDDFSTPRHNSPPYVDGLNLNALGDALRDTKQGDRLCPVEGICLRTVLDRCGLSADVNLYVKRIGENGLWYDQFHLEDFERGEGLPGDSQKPHASDLSYHSRARPHDRADWEFIRVETNDV